MGLLFAFSPAATKFRGPRMIWVSLIVTVFLFIYLLVALLRPEWF